MITLKNKFKEIGTLSCSSEDKNENKIADFTVENSKKGQNGEIKEIAEAVWKYRPRQ